MAACRGRGAAGLTPIGVAIGGMLALTLAVAAGVIAVLFALGQFEGFRKEPLTAASLYDLLKIGFAFAAGIAGVVALVTAYRRQRVAEFGHELDARAEEREAARLFNERFATAAGQLGDERPAVRLGVYAMAGLADDWSAQRQTCLDVLCGYLRMPFDPEPADDAPRPDRQAFRAVREVRHTVIRVITAHLQSDDGRGTRSGDWCGLDLDFTGAVFDGGDFSGAQFTGGTVDFRGAQFTGGTVNFAGAQFTDGDVDLTGAQFTGGTVYFGGAQVTGGTVSFGDAQFADGNVYFGGTRFTGGTVYFGGARFTGSDVHFRGVRFTGSAVHFGYAEFTGGTVDFRSAQFTSGDVDFEGAEFTGGTVDFSAAVWSVPPHLPFQFDHPPAGVWLNT